VARRGPSSAPAARPLASVLAALQVGCGSLALLAAGCGSPAAESPVVADGPTTPADPAPASSGVAPEIDPGPVATPDPVAAEAAVEERVRAVLGAVIDREAGNPANAWALSHGILARGPDFRATDGRLARDVLVDDWLQRTPDLHFETQRGEVRVEPHADLILKTLVEAGLPLDAPIGTTDGSPTLRALLDASRNRAKLGGADGFFPSENDAPWSVQAWCQAGPQDSWTASGRPTTSPEVAEQLLGSLERQVDFIVQARAAGKPFAKRKQDIFAFTCGGAHLFQGAAACVAAGSVPDAASRIAAVVDTWLARVPLETGLVDAAIKQHPDASILLVNQDIKFLGHLLESLGKAQRDGLWTPTAADREILKRVKLRLYQQILRFEAGGIYADKALAGFAANPGSFQLYLDLVGDACHAWSGMRIQAALPAP